MQHAVNRIHLRRGLSMLLSALLLLQLLAPPVLAAAEPVPLGGGRIDPSRLDEGNYIYFGAASVSLPEQEKTYTVPVYREGDLSGTASVTLHSLDLSAVYGRDYTLYMAGVKKTGDGLSMLERGVREGGGTAVPIGAAAGAVQAAEAAPDEEAATAAEPPEQALVQEMSGELVADAMADVPYSGETVLTFAPGEAEKTVTFRILDDREPEGTEGFSLLLVDPVGAELNTVTSLSVNIEDDEPAEYARLSFTQPRYESAGGVVTVRIRREDAPYAFCTAILSTVAVTAQAGVNYQERNEELTFMPYEEEKEIAIPVAGEGEFSIVLREFRGAEPGAIREAEVSVREDPETVSYALTQAEPLLTSGGNENASFGISIGGKSLTVRYNTGGLATTGRIVDTSYQPELEVGVYHFAIPSANGGPMTAYGTTGSGSRCAEYRNDNRADAHGGRTYLYWYSGNVFKDGMSYAEGWLPNALYYQTVSPDWAVYFNNRKYQCIGLTVGGGNYGFCFEDNDNSKVEFGRTQDNRVASFKDNPYASNEGVYVYVKAHDHTSKASPSNELDLWGFCCLYKKFRVSIGTPEKLKYLIPGGTVREEPIQVQLNSGAGSPVAGDDARIFYVKPDPSEPAAIIPTFSASSVNGTAGNFGHVQKYILTFTDNDGDSNDTFTIDYPGEELPDARYQDLSKIILDEKVISLIETRARERGIQNIRDAVGSTVEFYRDMTITPVYTYDDIEVEVLPCANGHAVFKDSSLQAGGRYTCHAGDTLSLGVVVPDDELGLYQAVGYEVSVDGVNWNTIRDTESLFLQKQGQKQDVYQIRPVVADIGNCIELRLTEDAKQHLTVLNTVPESDLSASERYAGKTILNLNPAATSLSGRINPNPGQVYTVAFAMKESDENKGYVYLPVIRPSMDTRTYTTNTFYMKAASAIEDNVLEVDVVPVKQAFLTEYTLSGTVSITGEPIRYSGIEAVNRPVPGYSVTLGTGKETEASGQRLPDVAGVLTDGTGRFSLSGILGRSGDIITAHVSNGASVSEVVPIKLGLEEQQDTGELVLPYPYGAPRVVSISYEYAKNNASINNNDNQLPILDDQVTFTASVDSAEITKAVFTRYSHLLDSGGNPIVETVTETVTPEKGSDGALLKFKINNLIKNQVKNGDKLSVRLYAGLPNGTEIAYPELDTGLSFYETNALSPPQFFSADPGMAIDIPIIGKATGTAQSGLLSFGRLDWGSGNARGYTLLINFDPVFTMLTNPSTKDKLDKVLQLEEAARAQKNAESAINELYGKEDTNNRDKEVKQTEEILDASGKSQAQNPNAGIAPEQNGAAGASSPGVSAFSAAKITVDVAIVMGFDYLYSPEKNQYVFCSGTFALGGTFQLNKTIYKVIRGVPVFLNVCGTLQGDAMVYYPAQAGINEITADEFYQTAGNLSERFTSTDYKFSILIGTKIQAGSGMCGVLSARGYIAVNLQANLALATGEKKEGAKPDEHWGVLLAAAGGLGIDMLLFSINLDVAAVKLGYGSLQHAMDFAFFGGMLPVKWAERESGLLTRQDGEDTVLTSGGDDTMSLHTYGAGSANLSGFGRNRTGTLKPGAVSVLLTNAAERTRPQLISLGNGKRMLLFIGSRGEAYKDGNELALYYAVGDETNGWGTPVMVSDDGTADSTPSVRLLPGGKAVIAWADAGRAFTASDSRLDKLKCMGISLAVYDIQAGTMGPEIELARENEAFDLSPRINPFADKIIVSFIRRGLSAIGSEAGLTDLSQMTTQVEYRVYDPENGGIISKEVALRALQTANPLTLGYDAETLMLGETGYMLNSYAVDLDGNVETTDDHELYLGIDNLTKQTSCFPIRIRGGGRTIIAPKLTTACGRVFLTWIENNTQLCLLDVSELLTALFAPEDGETYSAAAIYSAFDKADKTRAGWEKQSEDALGLDEEDYRNSVYEQLAAGELQVQSAQLGLTASAAQGVSDYVTATDGKDVYFFYTRMSNAPDNAGTNIFGLRYRYDKASASVTSHAAAPKDGRAVAGFGREVQITDNQRNYVIDELSLYMDENGSAHAVCNYYSQNIRTWDDPEKGYQAELLFSPNALAAVDFVTAGSLSVPENSVTFPAGCIAGQRETLAFEVYNGGLLDAQGYQVTVTGAGDVVYDQLYTEALGAGETRTIRIPWTVPSSDAGSELTFTVRETGVGTDSASTTTVSIPNQAKLSVHDLNAVQSKEGFRLTGVLQNTGASATGPVTLELSAVDDQQNTRTLATAQVQALPSGGISEIDIPFNVSLKDFSDLGLISLRLLADDGEGHETKHFTRLTAGQPVLAEINEGAETLTIGTGKTSTLRVNVGPWPGVAGKARFWSDDSSVAAVNQDGVVRGVREGRADVYVCYPDCGARDVIVVSVRDGYQGDENYTVTFDTDGGRPVPAAQTVPAGGLATRPANDPAKVNMAFNGWYHSDGRTRFDFETYRINADTRVIALWKQITQPVRPSTSGGGSSGSSSSAPAAQTPAQTVPVSGGSGAASVGVSVSGTAAELADVTAAQLDQLSRAGSAGGALLLDMSALDSSVQSLTVSAATMKAFEQIVSSPDRGADSLVIRFQNGSAAFDAAVLAAICEQANGRDIWFNFARTDVQHLRSAQRSALKDKDVQQVYDFYLTLGGIELRDFRGGKVELTVNYTPARGQSAENTELWYVSDDGKTVEEIPCVCDGKTVKATLGHFSCYAIVNNPNHRQTAAQDAPCAQDNTCPISRFTDADAKAWYHDGVHWALENQVMNGTGEGRFEPNGTTTRAMVATMLWRLEGSPAVAGASEYSDVEAGSWYAPAVRWASAEGIINGYDDPDGDGRLFAPNAPVTREQLAAMLYRYAQSKGPDFTGMWMFHLDYPDAASVSEWADEAMHWVTMHGIVNGIDGKLAPQENATRAQVATMFMRCRAEID